MAHSQTSEVSQRFQVLLAFRNRNFRWFWLNGATQAMAQGMQFLILGWLVLDISSSSYQLGLVIFAFGLPSMFFALLGGIISDRYDRIKLLISTRFCVSALIFALAVLRIFNLLEIWHVYTIVFLLGVIQGLNGPARMAVVPDLVDRDGISNAIALHSMVHQTGQIMGPAVAGGIIELSGIGPILLVNGGLYLSGIVFLLLIRGLPSRSAAEKATVLEDFRAGLRCIRTTPVLYTVIGMMLAFAFFRCVISSGHARLYQRSSGNWSGRDRFLVAGGGAGITVWKSDISLAGGLSTQGAAAHGFGDVAFCGPDLVRLVALVLGIMGDFIVCGSD